MDQIPFEKEELRSAVQQYQSRTKNWQARTLDADSFWDEEERMLAEFPEKFQQAGCIPEPKYLKCLSEWKWAGLWGREHGTHENTREEIRRVTSDAFQQTADDPTPKDEAVRQQLDRLGDLIGISAATGTVLLTFWRPNVYTVMDEGVLEVLAAADCWTGNSKANIDEYPQYLDICRSIARETGLSLRDTDRALWALGQ